MQKSELKWPLAADQPQAVPLAPAKKIA
jgi:hypothetical protein